MLSSSKLQSKQKLGTRVIVQPEPAILLCLKKKKSVSLLAYGRAHAVKFI